MLNINLIKNFFIIIFILFFYSKFSAAIENKILIKVNNEIITSIDVLNEINYLKTLNPKIESLGKERLIEIQKHPLHFANN